jgi:hypothetical protein
LQRGSSVNDRSKWIPDYYTYSQTVTVLENFAGRLVSVKINADGSKATDTGVFTYTSSKSTTGVYSIVFSDPMSSNDYTVLITPQSILGVRIANIYATTTTGFIIYMYDHTNTLKDSIFSFFVTK